MPGMNPLTDVPQTVTAGTTVKLSLAYDEYPVSEGWGATLYLAGLNLLDPVVATVDGTRFAFTLAAASTARLAPGNYQWRVVVEKSGERYVAAGGVTRVLPDIATARAGDLVSWEESALAVVESALAGRLSADMQSYQIGGRAIVKIPYLELLEIRARLKTAVQQQQNPGSFGSEFKFGFTGTSGESPVSAFRAKYPWRA